MFFGQSTHANGTKLYSARIIPFRGSWIEFATDINNVMYAYIDRKKKLPVTTLLRAIGLESDKDIIEIFDLAEEVKVNKTNLQKAVGRRLAARVLNSWVEDFVDEDTGEVVSIERNDVIVDRETELSEEDIQPILESGAKTILLQKENVSAVDYSIIFNTLQKDTSNSEKEAIQYIYRQLRNAEPPDDASAREVIQNLFFSEKRYDLGEVGRFRINKKLELDTSMDVRVLTREDIIAIIKYLIELINAKSDVDDIDHLSNRRVRTVGEQLYNQFGVGLARMSRTIRERMNVRDNEVFTPIDLINAKTIASVSPWSRRSEPRTRRFRGARRTLHTLRPSLPHRDPRRSQHRPDIIIVRIRQNKQSRIYRDALPPGNRRPGKPEKRRGNLSDCRKRRGQDDSTRQRAPQ